MADALGLQYELPDVPEEEKASNVSVVGCTNSLVSIFLCYAK